MVEEIDYTNRVFYTLIGVRNDTYYSTTVNLGGMQVVLEFGYNSRLQRRWISAKSTRGIILLKRTFLTLNSTTEFNINSDLLGKKVYLLFDSIRDDLPNDYDFFDWQGKCAIQFTHFGTDVEADTDYLIREFTLGNL